MAKRATKKPSFEEAIEKLESLVEHIEGESLPLEELLSNYEEGNKLLQHCQSIINSARERIEVVKMNQTQETENKLASRDSAGETPPPKAEPKPDDIQLF